MKSRMIRLLTLLLVVSLFASCVGLAGGCGKKGAGGAITLATTTSTENSGLLDVLLPAFTEDTGIEVKVLVQGTGQALETASRGDADVVLVHARSEEDAFIEAGHGVERFDVMYNDFVVVGPEGDPAGVSGADSAGDAFQGIATAKGVFVSRGDDSGTHTKEKALWEANGLDPVGSPWYLESGSGMGDTLRMAYEKHAYTFSDRATYLSLREQYPLSILFEGDPVLFNQYGVIAVSPEVHRGVNHEGAKEFIAFITGVKGQEIIGGYGREKYGQPLFVPNASPQGR